MVERGYIYTMDIYPQQYEDMNRVYKFYEYLREENKLTTTKCNDCGKVHWPPRVVCRECLSDNLEYIDLPSVGKVVAFSVSYAGVAPQFTPPVTYAIIDYPEYEIRLISPLIETDVAKVEVGSEVELKIVDVDPDQDGRKRVMFFYKLKE